MNIKNKFTSIFVFSLATSLSQGAWADGKASVKPKPAGDPVTCYDAQDYFSPTKLYTGGNQFYVVPIPDSPQHPFRVVKDRLKMSFAVAKMRCSMNENGFSFIPVLPREDDAIALEILAMLEEDYDNPNYIIRKWMDQKNTITAVSYDIPLNWMLKPDQFRLYKSGKKATGLFSFNYGHGGMPSQGWYDVTLTVDPGGQVETTAKAINPKKKD